MAGLDVGSKSSQRRLIAAPPGHLSPSTKAWWKAVVEAYQFEPYQLRALQIACESWDRKEQARLSLAATGLVFKDGRGGIRPRPEVQIERDCRIAFLRALRELKLEGDDEPRVGGIGVMS